MLSEERFIETALEIKKKAPSSLWEGICSVLCASSFGESKSQVLAKLPGSVNPDLLFLIDALLAEHGQGLTWREIGLCLWSVGETTALLQADKTPEIVWSGPATETFPVRRIDQVLYDLIAEAQKRILLVTFAAAKIELLCKSVLDAIDREVRVTLILEFESESQGQLSFDALTAFSGVLAKKASIYYWPLKKRERNEAGNPGKLHAKCAVIDNNAVISSANLTDDAFNRNMELGVLFRGGPKPQQLVEHFARLIASGVLNEVQQIPKKPASPD